MLIAVVGSSGLHQVEGITSSDPAALLRAVGSRARDHVIVLAPWYAESVAKEQAHVLIAAEPRARVAVLALQHHPLTLTLIAAAVQQGLRADADAGAVLAMLGQAADHSRSLVWYPRVWGLHEPAPTVRQLLASSFRSPGFFREIGPDPALVPARSGSPVGPHDEVYVAGSSPELLHSQLGTDVRTVPVDLEPKQPWATTSAVPLTVLVGPSPRSVVEAVCRSCAAHTVSGRCLFCGTGPARPAESSGSAASPVLAGAAAGTSNGEGVAG